MLYKSGLRNKEKRKPSKHGELFRESNTVIVGEPIQFGRNAKGNKTDNYFSNNLFIYLMLTDCLGCRLQMTIYFFFSVSVSLNNKKKKDFVFNPTNSSAKMYLFIYLFMLLHAVE